MEIKYLLVILSKKTYYDAKNSEIEKEFTDHNHDQYITSPEFNTLTVENLAARLAQANLMTYFDNKLMTLNGKINSNKIRHALIENKIKKLQTFGSSFFLGKSHVEEYGAQNYLVFQPINRSFKRIIGVGSGEYIYFLKW